MIRQTLLLTEAAIKEFFREPGTIFWALLFPILMAGALGLAFSKGEVEQVRIAVALPSDSPRFRQLQQAIAGPGSEKLNIELIAAADEDAALRSVRHGEAALYVTLDADGWRAHLDPSATTARTAWLAAERRLQLARGVRPAVNERLLSNLGDRYIDFLAPGMVAMGVMNSCLWGVGFGLIDLRTRKLLRRMAASPMSRAAFLLAQLIARLLFISIETGALLLFTWLFFGQQNQGAWGSVALLLLAGIAAFGGIAIFAASRAESLRAANGIVNALTLPMMVLSGIFFSYRNFPDWLVPILSRLPLSILADALRAVFNEGAGLTEIALPTAWLGAIGLCFFTLGMRMFRWR
ncbi:MAG: ABC transporter permease [Leptospirales bacterium]|nr:ABC transporter permease [Leptospirales bacterium]